MSGCDAHSGTCSAWAEKMSDQKKHATSSDTATLLTEFRGGRVTVRKKLIPVYNLKTAKWKNPPDIIPSINTVHVSFFGADMGQGFRRT